METTVLECTHCAAAVAGGPHLMDDNNIRTYQQMKFNHSFSVFQINTGRFIFEIPVQNLGLKKINEHFR